MSDRNSADPKSTEGERYRREEKTEAVGGAIGGATGGAMVGGLALGTLGPLGAVLGVLAGYAGGWWAGETLIETAEELDDVNERLRELHEELGGDRSWTETRHAYQLGYLAGRNPRWGEGDFETVEADLRRAWVEAHEAAEDPFGWDEVRRHAERGWDVGQDRG